MPRTPWWKEYRRQQLKLKPINIELILRKSLRDTAKEYVTHSSLGCIHQIGDPRVPNSGRMILLAMFSMMIGLTCYFIIFTLSNTLTKPLIVSMESSTYPISDIDFPAVAICNINRISKKTLQEYASRIYPNLAAQNASLEELEWWLHQYGRLLDSTWDERLGNHPFMDIRSKYHIKSSEIVHKMRLFAPKCDDTLLNCFWAGNRYNCSDLFSVRRTFRGHCCVFNYVLDYNAGGRPRNTIAKVKRQVEPGPLAGLAVFLDPMLQDYEYPLHRIQGFDIFLYDPAAYPDPYVGRVVHRVIEANKAVLMELMSVKQIATNEIRKYPWGTRNCLFRDEIPMYGDMYSYSACLIHCRIRTVQSLCKCTPYFLPADIRNTEICTMEKLRCLNKYKEKLLYIYPQTSDTEGLEVEIQDSMYCPNCLPDCEFTKHSTRVSKMPLSVDEFTNKEMPRITLECKCTLLAPCCRSPCLGQLNELKETLIGYCTCHNTYFTNGDIDIKNKSLVLIYQSTPDGVLERLDVVSYWFEVLSNFGGFAGIVIGFSIVTVNEIIYFFCIRFCGNIYVNYKRYR